MKTLVLGGSLFIGKHVTDLLYAQKHEIDVLNRGTHELKYPKGVTHLKADRKDKRQLTDMLQEKQYDWVFDISAYNGEDTQSIIDVLKGKIKRFIHISTAGVGISKFLNELTFPYFEEDASISDIKISSEQPPYIVGKQECEKVLLQNYKENEFPFISIRPTFVYGPDNYLYREAFFFDRIRADRPILIPEFMKHQFFDLVHVDDVAKLSLTLANHQKGIGDYFHCSSGELVTGENLAKLIGRIMDREVKVKYYNPQMLEKLNWPKNQPIYPYQYPIAFSMLKTAREFNFTPIRLKSGLKMTYNWWLQQKKKEIDWSLEDQLINKIDNA
ncbi:MAG: NAD-dependent epimerase/dehydratase family protein [Candidatus Hodarchaeales archaeon]|jgi:nucleoside-diphosphate-sugar epimerase